MLDPFSAYEYNQKADKVDFPIFQFLIFWSFEFQGPQGGPNIFFDPQNHVNVHKMAKLELPNRFGSVL